jgi:hypothetical protein
MKKLSFFLPIAIMVLSAGCNQSAPTIQNDRQAEADAPASQDTGVVPVGWHIYTSPFGYEIAYPTEWYAADAPQNSASTLSEYDIAKRVPDYNSGPLVMQIYVKDTAMEAELDRLGKNKTKTENATINGYAAKKLIVDTDTTSYYLEKNGKTYILTYSFDQSQGVTREESEKVLGTFKLK